MVDGVFSRAFKSGVRPIELGRRMIREMDEHRSVDVRGRRIVPNQFVFWLSPTDYDALNEIGEVLVTELCQAARDYARDEGFLFLGPVSAELAVHDQLRPGRFAVSSQMHEVHEDPRPRGGTLVLANGERLVIGAAPLAIGRLPECAVVVTDPNVSRRHAEVRQAASGFVVVDLGSTNGTLVNGIRIAGEQVLRDGDIISVGTTQLRFEAS
jgi:hypothetical protein